MPPDPEFSVSSASHPPEMGPSGPDARRVWSRALPGVVGALLGSVLLIALLAPVANLMVVGGRAGAARLATDAELRSALLLTGATATVATLLGVLLGTPLSYLLARHRFRGRAVVAALLDLPLVLPHPVAGIALLLILGRDSAIGAAAFALGLRIVGSPAAIVAAMVFVSAPLFVSGAREAFERVDRRFESVALTLGDSPLRAFRRVTLPLAARGLLAAALVMWARAISEFGAIVILAHYPKTISVLSYDRFTTYGLTEALPVAAALVLVTLVPLALLRAARLDPVRDEQRSS